MDFVSYLCLIYTLQVTEFDVDDFLVDLYFYFDKSTKRKRVYETSCLQVKQNIHRWFVLFFCRVFYFL